MLPITMKRIIYQTYLNIEDKTKALLDEFAEKYAISRCSAVRMILRDFF